MDIKIIAVGKIKEKYLKEALQEYSKRLKVYCRLEIIEVQDEKDPEKPSQKDLELLIDKEGERVLDRVRERDYLILLDLAGRELSSDELAKKLASLSLKGESKLTFVIAGSNGPSEALRKRADEKISFSKMTFPHQLIRVFLLEQIYRSYKINRNEPYHK